MSRPASESVGAIKRTRTASSCADSVEPACSRHDAPPLPLPLPASPPRADAAAHLPNRSVSSADAAPPPPARLRKRARIAPDLAPSHSHPLQHLPASLHYHHYPLPFASQPYPTHAAPVHHQGPPPHHHHHQHHYAAHPPDPAPAPARVPPHHHHHPYPAQHHPSDPKRRPYHPPPPVPVISYRLAHHHPTALPHVPEPPRPHPHNPHHHQSSAQHHHQHHHHHNRPDSHRHTRRNPHHLHPQIRYPAAPVSSALPVHPPPASQPIPASNLPRPPSRRDRDRQPRDARPHDSNREKPHYTLPSEDDAEGHLIYKLGEGLHPLPDYPNGRYKILSELGEGTFGKVVECWDRRECQRVAIKVVRSVNKYREAARLEIDVLLHLNMHDPEGFYHCVKLFSWFDYKAHVCMVFEKLGPSLYEQLRRNRFRPFPLDQVREYAFQLLESVNFVHNLTLIHTDLKPENVLLIDAKRSNGIKLIDFGSATFESQHHSTVISTRHYRAPEVILGLGWTYPCDLWSIGCILVELYTGQALFQTHENLEHLAMMSGVLGPIPDSMIRRADGSGQKYFIRVKGGRRTLNWPGGASSKASIKSVRRVQSLEDIIRGPDGHSDFFDLVRSLLAFDPDSRCTSAEALRHPFFRETPHESDPPLTTPTLSSGSSACGSHGVNRGRNKVSSRKRGGVPRPDAARDGLNPPGAAQRGTDDDGDDDAATEPHTAAEHSDHTVVAAPISPRNASRNVDVS